MSREITAQLYHELMVSEFDFLARGVIPLHEIYNSVKIKFPNLCDDDYLCNECCSSGGKSPEWKHKVRTALGNLKKKNNTVSKNDTPTSLVQHINKMQRANDS